MEWAVANATTVVGAAMPVLTDHLHHHIDKETAVTLHKKAIEQADIHHVAGMKQNQELTQVQFDQAQGHHMAEKKLTEELHRKELAEANRLHRIEMEKSHTMHQAEMERSLDLPRQQIAQALKHHRSEMKVSRRAARKENLRDVWVQKSRNADTLLITVTVLFSCLVAEGNPPFEDEQPHEWITTLWSLLVWADFFCLTLCITLILQYTQRMVDYNMNDKHEEYVCGNEHKSYEQFYNCHVKDLASYAKSLFILGSNLLLLIGSITVASRFWLLYDNKPGAYILMIGGSVTIVVNEFFRFFYPTKCRTIDKREEEVYNDSAFESDEEEDAMDEQSGVNYGGFCAHSGAVANVGSSATPHSFKSPEDKHLYMNTQRSGNHLFVNSTAQMSTPPSLARLRKKESSKSDIDDQRSNGTLCESQRVSMTVVI